MSGGEPRPYNRGYEALVKSDDDLAGLVAYSLYKQHKRDWLISFRESRKVDPDQSAVESFLIGVRVPEQLAKYRQAAAAALVSYAQASLLEEEPRIREQAIAERVGTAAERIEDAGRWHRQLIPGIAAAAIWTLLLIAVAVVLTFSGIDLLDILQTLASEARPT